MKLSSLRIHRFRGIKELCLKPANGNFVVDGPNGTGKSGVVDAIDFVLTGNISRFSGQGTADLSVADHGPNVDAPTGGFVEATIVLSSGKDVTIKRSLEKPKKPVVTPASAAGELGYFADHPEVALSRRELIRFITMQAGKRSFAFQSLLKVDELEETRKSLTSARNSVEKEFNETTTSHALVANELASALELPKFEPAAALLAINIRRQALGLEPSASWPPPITTRKTDDSPPPPAQVGKRFASRLLADLEKELLRGDDEIVPSLLECLDAVVRDPELAQRVAQHSLLAAGLENLNANECPLCDAEWDEQKLRAHLTAKLQRSNEAAGLLGTMTSDCGQVRRNVDMLVSPLDEFLALAKSLEIKTDALTAWRKELSDFSAALKRTGHPVEIRNGLSVSWRNPPESATDELSTIRSTVANLPDVTSSEQAVAELAVINERLAKYLDSEMRVSQLREVSKTAAKLKEFFDASATEHLDRLYASIGDDLARYYRHLNGDDEGTFTARLAAEPGKLGFDVAFHDRGMHPPGAFHSEGHQDGMGLCLYLALMKQLFGERFSFCVLDDVVMSVDKSHRKRVCNLLKSEFPNTQFIITTHDDVWVHQMIRSGLVHKKAVKRLRTWTLTDGPVALDFQDAWEVIEQDLAKDDVPSASFHLRRHLEEVFGELCENLRAAVPYTRDGDHDLSDLLCAGVGKYRELIRVAKAAATSWNKRDVVELLGTAEEQLQLKFMATGAEQWVVNKAIHWNAWASFSAEDFRPVVAAFQALLAELSCPQCHAWLFRTTSGYEPVEVRCDCGERTMNLRGKSKETQGVGT